MSNYKINTNTISQICFQNDNTTYTDVSNNYFKNIKLTSKSPTFSGTINEKPNNSGYKYNGTDVSTFCIAPYVESEGSTAYSSTPVWCTKIRAVLVGGGGSGVVGQKGQHQWQSGTHSHYLETRQDHGNPAVNSNTLIEKNFRVNFHATVNVNHEGVLGVGSWRQNDNSHMVSVHVDTADTNHQTAGAGGGGGGSGAFVYIPEISLSTAGSTITLSAGASGQDTTLTVGSTTYTAKKGTNATGTTKGSGGTTTTISGATQDAGADGTNGTDAPNTTTAGSGGAGGGSRITTYASSFSYGKGGNGTAGTVGTIGSGGVAPAPPPEPSTTGIGGTNGYYRIYFLTS